MVPVALMDPLLGWVYPALPLVAVFMPMNPWWVPMLWPHSQLARFRARYGPEEGPVAVMSLLSLNVALRPLTMMVTSSAVMAPATLTRPAPDELRALMPRGPAALTPPMLTPPLPTWVIVTDPPASMEPPTLMSPPLRSTDFAAEIAPVTLTAPPALVVSST